MTLVPPGEDLSAKVYNATAQDLLPARFTAVGSDLPHRLMLEAHLPLSRSLALLVLNSERGTYAAPVVVSDDGVRRAVAGDGAAEALIAYLANGVEGHANELSWQRFDRTRMVQGERMLPVDQTHESVVVGDQAVVKWQVHATPTPAPTLLAHLEATGFQKMPLPWGFVQWRASDPSVLLASVTQYLPGATDGWDWFVDDVSQFALGLADLESAIAPARELGILVAQLHASLAEPSAFIDIPRRVARSDQTRQWHKRALSFLADALAGEVASQGDGVVQGRRDEITQALAAIATVTETPVISVHGDLHVGQILRWEGGYAINDFDGNPVLPPTERLLPQPIARDVAGMLQSLDHVGRVVVKRVPGVDADRVLRWIEQSQDVFLNVYERTLDKAGIGDLLDHRLLLPFRVEQECRELIYAQRHLPRWAYVPQGALRSLFP